MHLRGKAKLGYFPLPVKEAERISRCLTFPAEPCSVLDPCIGEGLALETITRHANAKRYGIELDAYRAEQARLRADGVVHGNCMDVSCAVESCSCLFINAPYETTCGDTRSERLERVFLEHTYRWLKPGGVLILVIPGGSLIHCSDILTVHFKEKRILRLTEPESVKYRQIVVFGIRRSRRERDQLKDYQVDQSRSQLLAIGHRWREQPALGDGMERPYPIPPSGLVELLYRGIPLDVVEDLLPRSPAYRQASRTLFGEVTSVSGRPLTPLHGGHVALLATSSLLDGRFGRGRDKHLAVWRAEKLTDHFEEEDSEGRLILRDRERFANTVTLLYADGRTAVLSERAERKAEE
jgi:SAM-dependent methyltransferase